MRRPRSQGMEAELSSGVTIRPMTEADLDRAAVLETVCFGTSDARMALAAELARSWAVLLVADEPVSGVVAFVSCWRVADEVHVLNVATDPAHRRRGHARALVASVMARARSGGASLVLLEVRPSNTAAIALYTAFGFRVVTT